MITGSIVPCRAQWTFWPHNHWFDCALLGTKASSGPESLVRLCPAEHNGLFWPYTQWFDGALPSKMAYSRPRITGSIVPWRAKWTFWPSNHWFDSALPSNVDILALISLVRVCPAAQNGLSGTICLSGPRMPHNVRFTEAARVFSQTVHSA